MCDSRSRPARWHPGTVTNVCVFCGASPGRDPRLLVGAELLGQRLAQDGFGLVYGAGGAGVMGALSDGSLRAGGHVTGVIPQALMDREYGRTDLSALHVVASMHERKALMYELSSAFVTLPGGLGTLEEFFETTTWNQLGLHAKPSFVLNLGGYYSHLQALLDHAVESGFVQQADRELVTVVDDVDELMTALAALRG